MGAHVLVCQQASKNDEGGELQVYRLKEFPEIVITRERKSRKHKWTDVTEYRGVKYDNVERAIDAYNFVVAGMALEAK